MLPIGAVVSALQASYPDVSHSALRFLEREGLVEPVRTSGGHRLYRQSDLERIRTIKGWQAERLSLKEIRARLEQMDALPHPDEVVRRFLDLTLKGENAVASREILLADELEMPLAVTFMDVLKPALYEVGERWREGSLSVGQEHEITELTRDIIAQLTIRHARSRPDEPRVVASCVADELHDLGLRMVCGVLRQYGAQVHFLGGNVSPEFLIDAVRERQPDVVLLSATLEAHQPALRATVDALRNESFPEGPPRIITGGQWNSASESPLPGADVVTSQDESLERTVQKILSLS
jgi:DNA-binding transcriptional MerR regulator/methylmalonyl-CoA mutase cobalamin-binding subunit